MKKKYYLLGIGGIAMANLAVLLKEKGHIVTGSDSGVFGPSAELLKKFKITYSNSYSENTIKKFKPDLVIIGNAISRGNKELEWVLSNRVEYSSMPEIISSEILTNKKPIVVTGTSGKTTTSSLIAWILHFCRKHPTILVGGTIINLNSGCAFGKGKYVVLEGDEYNSSFYDPSSKFLRYKPYIGVVNNIELDHLDIFSGLEDIIKSFRRFIRLIPQNGLLVLNGDNKNSADLSNFSHSPIIACGQRGEITATNIKQTGEGLKFTVRNKNLKVNFRTHLLGIHNVENILCATAAALKTGLTLSQISKAVSEFKGVRRRLEIRSLSNNLRVVDDFAHNPDKVLASLSALKKHYPKHKLVAVFEPRTGSSRRNIFQNVYPKSFTPADIVYVAEAFKKDLLNKREQFSNAKLVEDLRKKKKESYALKTSDEIVAHLKNKISPKDQVIICVMSSGDFGGMHSKLDSLLYI